MDTVTEERILPMGWENAYSRSHSRFIDQTNFTRDIKDRCSEQDGNPCRFLRAIGQVGLIVGYVCLFNKCVKRYPTEEDLMELEKIEETV